MRDVIVVGAGGGGAVIAKELAARGLDVLLLEAGARFADPERNWDHFESDANNPFSGYFRFGPADRSKPGWVRELPQSTLFPQLSGVGGTTNHYQGNSPRAMPGSFVGYEGSDRGAYDTAHLFPFSYRELRPYYEWVEETLPVQTAPMGTKEEVFFRGARLLGLPVQTTRDITRAAFRPQQNAILQPKGTAGKTSDAHKLRFPQAKGCTFCGHCSQGCMEPLGAPINLKAKRSTSVSYIPMALTCDLWRRSGRPVTLISDAFAVRINTDSHNVARGITWRIGATGELSTEEAAVVVLSCGTVENPRLWLNSGMGLIANDSVLDENAESRWVKRLFVADNSALANGLGSVNPTLTTQALATRTAEKIFRRYFGGDPWVQREAPVSSIDSAVTRAVIERGL